MTDCRHTQTQGRPGEEGYWCLDCGEKVMEVEKNPCGSCKNFRRPLMSFGYCTKLSMAVTEDLCITYKIQKGSCWEQKDPQPESTT